MEQNKREPITDTRGKELLAQAAFMLKHQGLKLAFAESATGGLLCASFAALPHAGDFLQGSIVCYDAGVKINVLQLDPDLIERFTAESAEVTSAMAKSLTSVIEADIHLAVTGLASPGGSETPEKPVGTMFFAALKEGTTLFNIQIQLDGDRETILQQACYHCAELLTAYLA